MKRIVPVLLLAAGLLAPAVGFADDGVTPGQFTANNVWMMLAAGLVFIMHLGFAT
ncbi:MAG: ammonium transporter, partial [Deltaproteobacteria bacterium]